MKTVALITGASSGIGKEFAYVHAQRGGDLVVVARSENKLEQLKAELEQKYQITVRVIVKDLSRIESAREVYNELKGNGIEIDYLINNAGFGGQGKFHERDWEKDLAMINVNIITMSALTRLFLSDFIEKDKGRILNVSSIASLIPGPLQSVYFATKVYGRYFTNAIFEEISDTNVTITALLPGVTETSFAQTSGMVNTRLFSKTVSARRIADDGYNGMLKGKLNVISGMSQFHKLIVFLIPFLPMKMLLKVVRNMQEVKPLVITSPLPTRRVNTSLSYDL